MFFSCFICMSNNEIQILLLVLKYLTKCRLHIGSTSSVENGGNGNTPCGCSSILLPSFCFTSRILEVRRPNTVTKC